jgi:toxin ParE1/3/4
MAKRYRVAVAEAAAQDLREIAAYIAHRDTKEAARRQLGKLRTRIRALSSTPTRGRFPPELEERGLRTWREVVVSPWRVIYRIEGRTVNVLVVLDGRRDLSELLLRRLTRPG